MKKLFLITLPIVFIFLACEPKNQSEHAIAKEVKMKTDLLKETALIEKVAEEYKLAWNERNLQTMDVLTTKDGEFYGSDPTEIMDKTSLMEMFEEFFGDTTITYTYEVNMRKIRVAPDGNAAMMMERITLSLWSPKMPIVQASHLVKINGKWKFDFISWGFIIKNEDVETVNSAL